MKQYIITAPVPALIEEIDPGTKQRIVTAISALRGFEMALQSITQGPKLFDVWALRKKIKALMFENGADDARYLILNSEEKELLLQAAKTIDWTFQQKLNFWTTWTEFLECMVNIAEFDEKNPPVAYVEWKQAFEARLAAIEAERKAAEARVLAERQAAEQARKDGIAAIYAELATTALANMVAVGKLGDAATIDDLPAGTAAELTKEAEARFSLAAAASKESAEAKPAVAEEAGAAGVTAAQDVEGAASAPAA